MSILEVFPQLVQVVIGGKSFRCGQLRVRDLAAVQFYLESVVRHPYEDAREQLDHLEGIDLKRALRKIENEAENYPPTFPSPFASIVLSTPEGTAFLLGLVLGRHQEITAAEAVTLARTITSEERAALDRILWASTPAEELDVLLTPSSSIDGYSPPVDMARMVDDVATSHGWTYEEVGSLTISQFGVARRGCGRQRTPAPDVSHLSHEELCELLKQQREGLED